MLITSATQFTTLARPEQRNPAPALSLRLFGPMQAWTANGENALPNARKSRALLAMLALAMPRPRSRVAIAETLWSGRPEEQARGSLRQEIYRMMESLGPLGAAVVSIEREQIALRGAAVWTDIAEVRSASLAAPQALQLIGGELLADLNGLDAAFDAWLRAERTAIRSLARHVAEAVLEEQTDPDGVIAAAQQVLAIDRVHEEAWRALIRAYAARGERGLAIEAFERCRAALGERLSALPSEETRALLAEIRIGAAPVALTGRPRSSPTPPWVRSGRRLGVLPLEYAGEDRDLAERAVVLAEEITTALAPFRWMDLVSCSALSRFAAETRDEAALRRFFGLDLLVDGRLQQADDMLRVTLRLIDLDAGNQIIWVERFDHRLEDRLGLQDRVAALAAARIDREIQQSEIRRLNRVVTAAGQMPRNTSAYDLMVRALGLVARLEPAEFMSAGPLLELATELAPDYAAPHAVLAAWCAMTLAQGWAAEPPEMMARAQGAIRRALSVDPQNARALSIAGQLKLQIERRHEEAIALHDRALTLNPHLPMAWGYSGMAAVCRGDFAEAERRLGRYRALLPFDPEGFLFDPAFALLALLRGDFAEAAAIARGISEIRPTLVSIYPYHLAALGHLGRVEEAAEIRARLAALRPGYARREVMARTPIAQAAHREILADGLRRAGLSED